MNRHLYTHALIVTRHRGDSYILLLGGIDRRQECWFRSGCDAVITQGAQVTGDSIVQRFSYIEIFTRDP